MKLAGGRLPILLAVAAALAFLLVAEPFAAPPDCASYWAWGESLLLDFDFDFSNQYERALMPTLYVYITKTQHLANDWPMGSGLALMPWLAGGKLLGQAWVCMLAVAAMGLAAPLIATCRAGRAFALGAMLSGTPLFFYVAFGPFFSHAISFTATTVFLVAWAATREKRSVGAWWLLGLLLGFAALVRPQNGLLGVVFLAELPAWRDAARRPSVKALAGCALATVLAFAPALIGYNLLYGSPLALPKADELHWLSPEILKTIFSDFHGLMPWTPVYALGVAGLVVLARRDRTLGVGLLLVFAVQLYINAANVVWWSGGSFGNRRMADGAIVIAFGLGALWGAAQSRAARGALIGATGLCVAWTLTLVLAERRLLVPLDRFIPFLDEEFPARITGVFSAPMETLRAVTRPFIAAMDSGSAMMERIVCAIALGAGVFVLTHFARAREGKSRVVIAANAGTVLAAALAIACGIAAIRTPVMEDPGVLERTRREPGILWDNYVELAYYEITTEDYVSAEAAARRAVSIRPEHPTPWWYLGVALAEQGRNRECAEALAKVLAMNPEHAGARQLMDALPKVPAK